MGDDALDDRLHRAVGQSGSATGLFDALLLGVATAFVIVTFAITGVAKWTGVHLVAGERLHLRIAAMAVGGIVGVRRLGSHGASRNGRTCVSQRQYRSLVSRRRLSGRPDVALSALASAVLILHTAPALTASDPQC